MTDPIAYEQGTDHQLDVYEVLALIARDDFADTAAAADAAVADDLAGVSWDTDHPSRGEYLNEQDESSEDYYDHPYDDGFTFVPDYLRS